MIRTLKGRAGKYPSGVMAGQYAQAPALPLSHMRLPQSETIYTAQLQSTSPANRRVMGRGMAHRGHGRAGRAGAGVRAPARPAAASAACSSSDLPSHPSPDTRRVRDIHAEEQDNVCMPGSRPGGPLLLLPRAHPRIRLRWQDDPPQTVKARVGGRLFHGCTPSVLTYCSMRTWANSHEVNLFPPSPVM